MFWRKIKASIASKPFSEQNGDIPGKNPTVQGNPPPGDGPELCSPNTQGPRTQSTLEDLALLLNLSSEDVGNAPKDADLRRRLIRAAVPKHFPRLPEGDDVDVKAYLSGVKQNLSQNLLKWITYFPREEYLSSLVGVYHCHTVKQLKSLLGRLPSASQVFSLLRWLLKEYLSMEILGNPEFQDKNHKCTADLFLYVELVAETKDKLLEEVKEEVCSRLSSILQNQVDQKESAVREDAQIRTRLQVDAIQHISALIQEAGGISLHLEEQVEVVCLQELRDFLNHFRVQVVQKMVLETKGQAATVTATRFLRTLNTLNALEKWSDQERKTPRSEAIRQELRIMKSKVEEKLKETISSITEKRMKSYFKESDAEFSLLLDDLKETFDHTSCSKDLREVELVKARQRVELSYLKHLVDSQRGRLEARWGCDVGARVSQDAETLHSTFSRLSAGVGQQSLALLAVREALECGGTDALKVTLMEMEARFQPGEVRNLLRALLHWKGTLSGAQIAEVLGALPGPAPQAPSRFSFRRRRPLQGP